MSVTVRDFRGRRGLELFPPCRGSSSMHSGGMHPTPATCVDALCLARLQPTAGPVCAPWGATEGRSRGSQPGSWSVDYQGPYQHVLAESLPGWQVPQTPTCTRGRLSPAERLNRNTWEKCVEPGEALVNGEHTGRAEQERGKGGSLERVGLGPSVQPKEIWKQEGRG